MAYTITLTDGSFVTLIPDNTVNTTALPVNLFGRGYVNYGMALNENFVFILENFSDSAAPNNPLVGQLWYNNIEDVLYLRSVSETWVPIQTQIDPSYKEITVLDGNGNSAELDGTGNLYLQTTNPTIAFLTTYTVPLSSGNVVASINLTSGGVLQIQPGLNVIGPQIIQGSLDVSSSTSTNNLTVVNSTTTSSLTVGGNTQLTGTLNVGGAANFGVDGLNVASNISAIQYGGTNSAVLEYGGILYLTRTNTSDYAEIDFDDGTGIQGSIKLTNVGTSGWNAGATNPYALVIMNGLEVIGNCNITGNLTVGGTINGQSGGGGNYLPLAGGTLTGDLIIDQPSTNPGLMITNNAHPIINLTGTSPQGTTSGQASLVLEVDGLSGALTHYINSGGQHVMYLGPYGNGLVSVNMTSQSLDIFCPTAIVDGGLAIWSNQNQPPLNLYSHSGQPTTGGPSIMLCDPGSGSQQVTSAGYAMGISLQGNNNNNGNQGSPNNYGLQFGIFDGDTGQPASTGTNLMTLTDVGQLNVLGGVSTYGTLLGAALSVVDSGTIGGDLVVDGAVTAGGTMSCGSLINVGATAIHDGDFAAAYTGGETNGSAGYQKLPGGLIMMWGYNISGQPGSPATISFPNGGFPTACLNITATNTVLTSENHINVHIIDNTSFKLSNSPTNGFNDLAGWFAIGY